MAAEVPTARGRVTRQRIVESAAELFLRKGVHATGLDEILRAAGASKSQLYHYFSGKDDLVRAVADFRRDDLLAAQRPLFDGLDSWAGIESWFAWILAYQEGPGERLGCPIGSLASELAHTGEPAARHLAVCLAQWREAIAAGLARMRDRDELAPDADPERLAAATLAAIEGGLLLTRAERNTDSLEAALEAAMVNLRSWASRPAAAPSNSERRPPRARDRHAPTPARGRPKVDAPGAGQ